MATAARADSQPLVPVACSENACENGIISHRLRTGSLEYRLTAEDVPSGEAYLLFREFSFERLEIAFRYADGRRIVRTYLPSVQRRNWIAGARFAVPLPETGARPVAMSVSVTNAYEANILQALRIISPDALSALHSRELFIFGIFAGLIFVPFVGNAILALILRYDFQIAYALLSLSTLAYGIFWSNGIYALVPEVGHVFRYAATYVAMSGAMLFNMLFFLKFLEQGVVPRWLFPALLGTAGAFLGFSLYIVGNRANLPAPTYEIHHGIAFALLFLVTIACGIAIRRGSRYVWFYIASWLPIYIAAGLRIMRSFELIPHSGAVDTSAFGALAIEVFVMAAGIGAKVYFLKKERDDAAAMREKLEHEAETDPLTGLLNRRGLNRWLSANWGRHGAVVLIDLDYFKAVNDTHGHDGGDAVLIGLSKILTGIAPKGCPVARVGGEEFAIIVPEAHGNADDIHHAAASTLAAIRTARFKLPNGRSLRLTASMGIATGELDGRGFWAGLYRQADEALYMAKVEGRDRYVVKEARVAAAA